MIKVNIFLVFLMAMITYLHAEEQDHKLKVLVLYESLCPDSSRFMQHQLKPSYNLLKDYIDITLIPFGKSQSQENGAEFYCQHGPEECAGNRMQSCILDQTNNQDQQVNFVLCQMTTQDQHSIKHCAEEAGLSSEIDECMMTQIGTHLQLEAEKITHSYAPTFVPTIIYDRVFNQQLQDNSIRDFHGTVCSLLQKRGVVSFSSPVCQ